jgi:hypothetical protein
MVEGDQVPVIPFVEVEGNAGAEALIHNGPILANVGVIEVVMVMFNVAVEAHCPAVGVNVYVVVPLLLVLMVAGDQVPAIPFVDVLGKEGATEFWHKGPIAVNVGVVNAFIVTEMLPLSAQMPALGVNE